MIGLKKKCWAVPLPCSVYACLCKNLHSLDFLSFSDLAIYDSTATHFGSLNSATKKFLLIDLIGIFYQFHHVPSFRGSAQVQRAHVRFPWYISPNNTYAKINSYYDPELSFHKTCVAERLGPLYLSQKKKKRKYSVKKFPLLVGVVARLKSGSASGARDCLLHICS